MIADKAMRDEVIKAYEQGWAVIPLKEGSKVPNLPKGHPYLRRSPTSEEYKKFVFGNYGIVCGPVSGICVLDIDEDDGGMDSLKRLGKLPKDFYTPMSVTPNGMHLYFKYDPEVKSSISGLGVGLDVKSRGGYVVGPGSVVGDKPYYWWLEPTVELEDAPDFIKESKSELLSNKDWKIGDALKEGKRNNQLASLAGSLVARDIHPRVVLETLLFLNDKLGKPPLPEDEIVKIAESMEKHRGKGDSLES